MQVSRAVRRELERENAKMPEELVYRPREEWPSPDKWPPGLVEVWQSRSFLVQIYEPKDGATRLSVCRTSLGTDSTRWKDGITWDDLQRLKRECGRGNLWAVEIFPADRAIVNVANMRHLWLIPAPAFAWNTPTFNWTTPSQFRVINKERT